MTTNIEHAAATIREAFNAMSPSITLGGAETVIAQALADAGLLMRDKDPLSEIRAESYYEIQVRRFPGDTHWHSHFQGTESEVDDFLELNDQLLAIPSEYKRVVHVTTTKETTPITQEQDDV